MEQRNITTIKYSYSRIEEPLSCRSEIISETERRLKAPVCGLEQEKSCRLIQGLKKIGEHWRNSHP